MLLFSDGFEYFHVNDIWRKWGLGCNSITSGYDYCKIVQGDDKSVSPYQKYARRDDGKALFINESLSNSPATLNTHFKKSRTIFLGFGFRFLSTTSYYTIPQVNIKFYTKTYPGLWLNWHSNPGNRTLVATCELSFASSAIIIRWLFPSDDVPMQVGSINTNTDIKNGGWYYLQTGMSLHGNNAGGEDQTAWVKNILGKTKIWEATGIKTADYKSENSYYINSIGIELPSKISIDDVYICNDEGDVNSTFLNPIHVRSVTVYQQGQYNQSEMINAPVGVDRATLLSADRVGTQDTMPDDPPTPEEDQHFVGWEDVREQYIRLNTLGDKQTFRHTGVNFAGSEPDFHGLIAYPMMRSHYYDFGQTSLEPLMYSETQQIEASMPLYKPVQYLFENEWEARRLIFENPRTNALGHLSEIWNRTALNNIEVGFKLIRHEQDINAYSPGHLRLNYTHDVLIEESLLFSEWVSRYWEYMIEETLLNTSLSLGEWTFPLFETFNWSDNETKIIKSLRIYTGSVIWLDVYIPWFYNFVNEQIGFEDLTQITWLQVMDEYLGNIDSSYDQWVEEIPDTFGLAENNAFNFIINVLDNLIFSSGIRSNQELLEDTVEVISSYLFSGHELLAETLYPDDYSSFGWIERIFDEFGYEEEHYNGWYVAVVPLQFSLTDSILTQHWRHEWFMGFCIDSWQEEPIEQDGEDGNRIGVYISQFNDGDYWNIGNYTGTGF